MKDKDRVRNRPRETQVCENLDGEPRVILGNLPGPPPVDTHSPSFASLCITWLTLKCSALFYQHDEDLYFCFSVCRHSPILQMFAESYPVAGTVQDANDISANRADNTHALVECASSEGARR